MGRITVTNGVLDITGHRQHRHHAALGHKAEHVLLLRIDRLGQCHHQHVTLAQQGQHIEPHGHVTGQALQGFNLGIKVRQHDHRHVAKHLGNPKDMGNFALTLGVHGQLGHQPCSQFGCIIHRIQGARPKGLRQADTADTFHQRTGALQRQNLETGLLQQGLQFMEVVHHSHLQRGDHAFPAIERNRSGVILRPFT